MSVVCHQLNPHSCKTYLVYVERSHNVVLIDPVIEHVDAYRELLRLKQYTLTHVIDTHTHADHISGSAAMKDMTECEYVMFEHAPARCPTIRVGHGDILELSDGITLTAYHTPGHTDDSLCLACGDFLFTGDTLFLDDGGAGRDDLPGGDPGAHWESLRFILTLPGHLMVYPAHEYRGRKPSTLDEQKQSNPHLKPQTKEAYIAYLEDLRLGSAEWMADVLQANYACAKDPTAAWIPIDAPACEVMGTLDSGVNEIVVEDITPPILRSLRTLAEPPVLLDVREADELHGKHGHLSGIVHIPIGSLAKRLDELDKSRKIVTVCRSGSRAHTAAQILKKAGFDQVVVLNGGMKAWNQMVRDHR